MSSDRLSESVIGCIIRVHQELGPGFLENVYRRALILELRAQRLRFETEKEISIFYQRIEVGRHRLDLIVENRLILELKAVDSLGKAHYAQVKSYLKATGLPHALLVNFSTATADFRRITLG